MMKCGLLGRSLAHSYSPQIHRFFGDYSYELLETEPDALDDFFKCSDFTGLNVTIPYKTDVIPYCNRLSPIAQRLGAVNTIVRQPDSTLMGHNTDYYGFSSTIRRMGLSVAGRKALVLGSGGASRTAVAVLQELGADVVVISRSGENNYGNLHLHSDASLIVNATPVGMYPHAGTSPVDLDLFPRLKGVVDIIYNPARTRLLLDAEARNIPCQNGLWMLIAQAKEAAEWFTGSKINDSILEMIHRKLSYQMENLILIGMPGCGKSTVGQLLAEQTEKSFVDADAQIVAAAGMTIPEIFANEGEDGFRKWETRILQQLSQQSGLVIATGGGCVTRAENYPLLHQNGTVVWLKRDIANLTTEGRPLSHAGSLEQMYAIREPLYRQFADITFCNDGTPQDTVDAILKGCEP